MKIPLVSIVIPLYNYQKYIKDCIQSIINQDYENYEIIVVDDCSTDKSYKFAKKFECNTIKVIQLSKNSGYSKAKNEGIILSKGEYITALDADDLLTRNSISIRMKALIKHNADFIHANAIDIKANFSIKDCYKIKNIKRTKSHIHAQTVLVKRCVYKKFGLYDEKLRSRADKEMWCRLGLHKKGKPKIKKIFINKDVAYYRKHNESMMAMRKRNPKYEKKVSKTLKKQINLRKTEGITKDNTRFLES